MKRVFSGFLGFFLFFIASIVAVIAGAVTWAFTDWVVGLITGLITWGVLSLVGIVVFVAGIFGEGKKLVKDVQRDFESDPFFSSPSTPRDFGQYGAPRPPTWQAPTLPPDIARQYGVPQHPSPREFFGKQ